MKDAYEVLGVRKGAGKDEIVKKYDILLKKYRMNKPGEVDEATEEASLEEINRAYNLLMGYDTGEAAADGESQESGGLAKKLNVDKKKIDNFFYYYKYHILFSIIILVAVVFTVKGCVERVNPDLSIAFAGNFSYGKPEILSQKLKGNMVGVNAAEIMVMPMSEKMDAQQNSAMQMKAVVLMAAGDVDVFILDKASFKNYCMQGAFASLDSLADTLKIDKNKNKDFIVKPEDEKSEHLYGIDVSDTNFFDSADILGPEKVFAISLKTKHYQNAVLFLQQLLK